MVNSLSKQEEKRLMVFRFGFENMDFMFKEFCSWPRSRCGGSLDLARLLLGWFAFFLFENGWFPFGLHNFFFHIY